MLKISAKSEQLSPLGLKGLNFNGSVEYSNVQKKFGFVSGRQGSSFGEKKPEVKISCRCIFNLSSIEYYIVEDKPNS